jgi:hypothetical protein
MPTPFAFGTTEPETTADRTRKNTANRAKFASTPAAATRSRLRRVAAIMSASFCSTNAPTGTTQIRTPIVFTPIPWERATIPWESSWRTIPMTSATIP